MKMNSTESGGGDSAANPAAAAALDRNCPKDAQVLSAILKDMGILDYEPRVINQLLEFVYRYITTVLDDAKLVSSHAKKKAIDIDDIKLAVQMYTEESLTTPPGRDVLLEAARMRNVHPLPLPKPTCGIRLPPERFCITASNYRLAKSAKKKGGPGKSNFSNQNNPSTPKILMAPPGSTLIQQPSFSLATPGSSGGGMAMPKFQIQPGPSMMAAVNSGANSQQPMFTLTVNQQPTPGSNVQIGVKRKADDSL